ncbi:MAG: hypothetical protein H7270_16845, partial [Dermatophilaceae bacterium]|nr:hypothetical protein [Dermatophilaceae bacterium]
YDTRVTATTWSGDRVTGLRSLDRRTWAPDAVVMTLDRPAGRSAAHVLFPVPNLDHGHPLDWARLRGPYQDYLLSTVENAGYRGVGVPMVLISGRLAAERLTGHDPAYRSLAWR